MCSFSIVMERVFWSWDQMILIQIRCESDKPRHWFSLTIVHWFDVWIFFCIRQFIVSTLSPLWPVSAVFNTELCSQLVQNLYSGRGSVLVDHLLFFSICMHQAKRSLYTAFPYMWCIFWFVICLCLCSICGWCEAAACVFELKTVFKKIFHWLNRFSCLYISVLQPTTSDDYPNFGGDFFSNKNISFCVYLVKFCYQFRCVFDEKNEQKHSKKFNSNLIFGKS